MVKSALIHSDNRLHLPEIDLLQSVINLMHVETAQAQLALTKAALQQEAPDIAALGFEVYRHMLALDNEGPAHWMVMLEREPGQPCQPIVLLITEFPEIPIEAEAGLTLRSTVHPVAGEAGWQQFQALRSRNNMRD